jgi:hypothetical protein
MRHLSIPNTISEFGQFYIRTHDQLEKPFKMAEQSHKIFMKNTEFVALAVANSVKSQRIRCYIGRWYTGASRLPCDFTVRIGSILSLIHAQIDQGKICSRDEMLLLYNFQPLHIDCQHHLISIDLLVKPLTEIYETNKLVGRPVSLALNCKTGEVMNASQSLLLLGLISMDEILEENMEEPIVYGNYHDFNEYVCYIPTLCEGNVDFISLCCDSIDDHSYSLFLNWPVFYSFFEVKLYLVKMNIELNMVAEVLCPKDEFHRYSPEEIRQRFIKLIDFRKSSVEILRDPRGTEDEEVQELEQMMGEETPKCPKEWRSLF